MNVMFEAKQVSFFSKLGFLSLCRQNTMIYYLLSKIMFIFRQSCVIIRITLKLTATIIFCILSNQILSVYLYSNANSKIETHFEL